MNTTQHWPGPQAFPPPTPAPRRRRHLSNEQVVSIVLACAGIGVTLIGVVLLLVMAAREGLLTPPVRVAGGAVLAGALTGLAMWVRPRPGGRLGSVAFLATGVAAAFFDTVAVTRIYHWIPLTAGLTVAFVVGGCAGIQAIRWNEKYLFHAVVLGVAGLAPCLTGSAWMPLVAFLIVLQVAGLVPEVRQQWDSTAMVRTFPAGCAASLWALSPWDESRFAVLAGCAVVAVCGMTGAIAAAKTRRTDIQAACALILAWIPIALAASRFDRPVHASIAGVMTVTALAGLYAVRKDVSVVRLAIIVLGFASASMLASCCSFGGWRAVPFLAAACALNAAHVKYRQRELGIAAFVVFAVGLILQATVASYLDLFYLSKVEDFSAVVPVVGILLLVFAGTGALSLHGKHYSADYSQALLVAHGFAAVLGAAMVIIAAMGVNGTGFFIGHLVVTVLSVTLAAGVLTAGLSRPRHRGASMVWGLALVSCGLTKLFLFDLHYMGTVTKAFTFMASGLVLLAAGTLYARTYVVASRSETPAARPNQSAMEANSASSAPAAWGQ